MVKKWLTLTGLLCFLAAAPAFAANLQLSDDASLTLPAVGSYQLRIITPSVLELTLITKKDPDPAKLETWNFELIKKEAGFQFVHTDITIVLEQPKLAPYVEAMAEKLAEAGAAFDEQSADAFGRVELVAGDRKKIELQGFDVDGNFSSGLHGVGVEVDVGFGGDAPNLGERLDGAEFVVGMHHGNENGFGAKGVAEFVETD